MDCSKTENFFKEFWRMCKSYYVANDTCDGCPLLEKLGTDNGYTPEDFHSACPDLSSEDWQYTTKQVQKWSDDNPPETVEQHFRKLLPHMNFNYDDICPCQLDDTLRPICKNSTKWCELCWGLDYEMMKGE